MGQCRYDIVFGYLRTQLPNHRWFEWYRSDQGWKIDHSAEWHLMIEIGETDVMNVAPNKAIGHLCQPLGMIDKS
jgi:hypothetical protein